MTFRRRLAMAVLAVCTGLVLSVSVLALWITASGGRDDALTADCIIVPGARVDADGHLGLCLSARVAHAIELYRAHRAAAIIFTGGRGESGAIESDSARAVAMAQGVPEAATYVERLSHDTDGNFQQAALIMRNHGWTHCLVCSDPFHVGRCVRLANDWGLVPSRAPAFNSPTWQRPTLFCYYTLRECAAWVKYELRQVGLVHGAGGPIESLWST